MNLDQRILIDIPKNHFDLIKVDMVRKPHHAMSNVIIPTYMLAVMSCFSFLVPAEGGERISFIITILLGMIFSLVMIESHAAQSGDNRSPIILNVVNYVYGVR